MASLSGSFDLALFAPYNEVVLIMGSWDDYKPVEMTRGVDGWWRYPVSLADGTYHYKYVVKSLSYFCKGEMVEIFDPYAFSITHDEYERAILKIKNGERCWVEYDWQHDKMPLPDNHQLSIYEMHIGDFTSGVGSDAGVRGKGTFRGAIEKIDYVKSLGMNAIELMPVKEFRGKSWGYSLRSLFAVENSYGAPEDLCAFVDACHARGMRVIIDGVYNHADSESPLTRIDYDYWFYNPNPDPDYLQWGPKFNYTKYDDNLKVFPARKYVQESIRYWVEKFHIDGIRFDATVALKDFTTMREMTDAAFEMVDGRKPFITIAEHIPEDPALVGYPEHGPMCAEWFFSLGAQLRAILLDSDVDGQKPDDIDGFVRKLDPKTNGLRSGGCYVNYVVSHDQVRLMHQLAEEKHIFDDAAFRRSKLGIGIIATLPGMPMLWMGQEFGFAADKSMEPRPLDWTLLDNDRNSDLLEFVKTVMGLRQKFPALTTDTFEIIFRDDGRKVLAYKRWNAEGNVVVVVINLRDANAGEVKIEGKSLDNGSWREHVHGYDVNVESDTLTDTLAECGIKVYAKK